MFSQFSIRQMLAATFVVAILVLVITQGMQQDNSMSYGVIASIVLLPVLFIIYGVVVSIAVMFSAVGEAICGPIAHPTSVDAATRPSDKTQTSTNG